MVKIFKRLSLTVIAVCFAATAVFAAACKEDFGNPAEMGYEITVLYPDGSPVKSSDTGSARNKIAVILTDDEGKQLNTLSQGLLDVYGKAHLPDIKTPGEYKITLSYLPKGFIYIPVKTEKDKARKTIVLNHEQTTYTINVKKPDGSAASGFDVRVMNGKTELTSGKTNAQGSYTTPTINAGTYNVLVTEPSGKLHHKQALTSTAGGNVDVEMFEPTVITLNDSNKMTDAQFEDWATLNSPLITYIDEYKENHVFTAETYGAEESFYILHANKAGTYTFNLRPDLDPENEGERLKTGNYLIKYYRTDSYDDFDNSITLKGSENGGKKTRPLSMEEGEDWIFSVSSLDGRAHYSVDIAISYNREPIKQAATSEGEYTLMFNENDDAVLEFSPKITGKYEISLKSAHEDNPKIMQYSNATFKPIYPPQDGESLYDAAASFPLTENYPSDYLSFDDNGNIVGGQTMMYHIFLDKVTSTSVQIIIKKVGEADPLVPEAKVEKVEVKSKLEIQQEPQGTKWTWLDPNGEQVPEKNEDGKYIVKINEKEYEVYVAITKNLRECDYSFATVEYMGGNERPTPPDGEPPRAEQQNNHLTVYGLDSTKIKYNYTDFIAEYAKYASSKEGVYALNDELKLFTLRYMNQRWYDVMLDASSMDDRPSQPWLLACGYFAPKTN